MVSREISSSGRKKRYFEPVLDFKIFVPKKKCSLKKSLHFESVPDFMIFVSEVKGLLEKQKKEVCTWHLSLFSSKFFV